MYLFHNMDIHISKNEKLQKTSRFRKYLFNSVKFIADNILETIFIVSAFFVISYLWKHVYHVNCDEKYIVIDKKVVSDRDGRPVFVIVYRRVSDGYVSAENRTATDYYSIKMGSHWKESYPELKWK